MPLHGLGNCNVGFWQDAMLQPTQLSKSRVLTLAARLQTPEQTTFADQATKHCQPRSFPDVRMQECAHFLYPAPANGMSPGRRRRKPVVRQTVRGAAAKDWQGCILRR